MIVTETTVDLFAHCRNAVCPGYGQEKVKGLRTQTDYQYADNGADLMRSAIERTAVDLRFADEKDTACRVCGQARELSEQERPSYQPLSGFDPMGLIGGVPAFDPTVRNTEADAKIAALEATVARLAASLEKEPA